MVGLLHRHLQAVYDTLIGWLQVRGSSGTVMDFSPPFKHTFFNNFQQAYRFLQLNSATLQLNLSRLQLISSLLQLNSSRLQLNSSVLQLNSSRLQLNSSVLQLNSSVLQLNSSVTRMAAGTNTKT